MAGFPAHKDWVLLANYIDPTLLKNSTAFKIASALEMEWISRNTHVDVYLNNIYQGNYLLCEQIKIDDNRVNITGLKESDIDEYNISGGYLLELDTSYDEEQKFRTKKKKLPVIINEPELNQQQLTWIESYFNNLENILYSSYYSDPLIGYSNYLDVESFIKF